MKKLLLILFVVIFVFSACSCSVKNTEPQRQDTSDVSSVVSEKEPETIPLVIAKELFDRNIRKGRYLMPISMMALFPCAINCKMMV